jgi:hypothetical protein
MLNCYKNAAMCLALGAVALLGSGCSSVSPDGKEWAPTPEGQGEQISQTSQALTGTHKLCSGVTAGNWRDTLVVNNTWTVSTCQFYASTVGAASFQLGCMWDNGAVPNFQFGTLGGGIPAGNQCGW